MLKHFNFNKKQIYVYYIVILVTSIYIFLTVISDSKYHSLLRINKNIKV